MKTDVQKLVSSSLKRDQLRAIKGGGDPYGYSYECNNGSGGFSTVGPTINAGECLNRCGTAGCNITPIY